MARADAAAPRASTSRLRVGLSGVVDDLSLLAIFAGRVLDECYDPACHEPGGPHGFARARDLDDLDDPATRRDLNAATSSCGDDLVGPRTVVRGNNDLDTIALHRASVPPRSTPAGAAARGRSAPARSITTGDAPDSAVAAHCISGASSRQANLLRCRTRHGTTQRLKRMRWKHPNMIGNPEEPRAPRRPTGAERPARFHAEPRALHRLRVGVSQAGFDGGLDPGFCLRGEEGCRPYGSSEEVPARAA
jgi:hypothetical protein